MPNPPVRVEARQRGRLASSAPRPRPGSSTRERAPAASTGPAHPVPNSIAVRIERPPGAGGAHLGGARLRPRTRAKRRAAHSNIRSRTSMPNPSPFASRAGHQWTASRCRRPAAGLEQTLACANIPVPNVDAEPVPPSRRGLVSAADGILVAASPADSSTRIARTREQSDGARSGDVTSRRRPRRCWPGRTQPSPGAATQCSSGASDRAPNARARVGTGPLPRRQSPID